MIRWHGWIAWALMAGLAAPLGCSPDSGTKDRTAGGPASDANATGSATGTATEAPTMVEMLDELPPLPTHWIADPPVAAGAPPVDDAMLRDPFADRSRWLHYVGDHRGHRHSPITSLTKKNVAKLQVVWAMPTGTQQQFEVSPIVYGGVMYVSTSYNRILALDVKTGAILWRYDHPLPADMKPCCGPVNRGVSIAGDTILMATLDARLLALDRRSGAILWNTEIFDYAKGYSATSAPFVYASAAGTLAVVGVAGGEYGIRGFFDAYDVATGKRVWRHFTIPTAGEPGIETWAGKSYETGGAPAWTQGAYDAETDTLFWTTGNPAPDFNGDERAGDNLYSNALLAVDAKTGARKWHFQFTPHDVWDYDGNTQIYLVEVELDGKKIPAIAQANRNGYFYLIDRRDGKFLRATQYVEQMNWATIGADGRPVLNAGVAPTEEPDQRVCPGNMGGMNGAWSGSYDPARQLSFIPTIEACQHFMKGIAVYSEGAPFMAGTPDTIDAAAGKAYGHVSAVDVATGEIRWRAKERFPLMAGAVSTAGGLVFTGNLEGEALALDADTGEVLWRFRMGGGVRSQPIVFELGGRPYLAIGSGSWATTDAFLAGLDRIPEGGHLFVFALPES
ncbi:MAG: PQQ-dependent dehydrogenase, methanol/ethanol family [Deltaproteobacteria bacterium]|nr:PQQ-dependent dehydrogenase, methanol/ethanol family [Deltaproteobacteria bacterium]